MKKICVLFFLFSSSVFAECNFYIQYETNLKENERGGVFEVISKHFEKNSYTIVGTLEKADAVLKVSIQPVLENNQFVYESTLKYLDTLGSIVTFTGRGAHLGDSLKGALAPFAKCSSRLSF